MERRKSMKTGGAEGPICARARSDLLHHVDAISLALKNWNDTEALKLLRLHWREIARAIQPDWTWGRTCQKGLLLPFCSEMLCQARTIGSRSSTKSLIVPPMIADACPLRPPPLRPHRQADAKTFGRRILGDLESG